MTCSCRRTFIVIHAFNGRYVGKEVLPRMRRFRSRPRFIAPRKINIEHNIAIENYVARSVGERAGFRPFLL
jgi:hypothetical protein